MLANPLIFNGAGGRNRTDKGLRPADFESAAFTYFTTPACERIYMEFGSTCQYGNRFSLNPLSHLSLDRNHEMHS